MPYLPERSANFAFSYFRVQLLMQELANQNEHSLAELEQACQDAERRAQVVSLIFADGPSTQ